MQQSPVLFDISFAYSKNDELKICSGIKSRENVPRNEDDDNDDARVIYSV